MSSGLHIRSASPADARLLADLGRRTFVDAFGESNDPIHVAEYVAEAFRSERVAEELADPGTIFLIAESEGKAVGYLKVCESSPPDCVTGIRPFEIERIYSERRMIGKGVGSALMGACLGEIETRGGETLWLGVWEHNDRAIRFYEKWGFEVVGAKEFALGGDIQTDIVMVRRLSL